MPGKIVTNKINHVTTMVKDTARAMRFYNDLIGIKEIQSQVENPNIFIDDPDGNNVEFCTASGYAPAPPRP